MNGTDIGRRNLKAWGSDREQWFFDLTAAHCERARVDTGDGVTVRLERADASLPEEIRDLLED